jgi:hypothetical protein
MAFAGCANRASGRHSSIRTRRFLRPGIFLSSLSKRPHLRRHPYRGGLTVKLATEEVNDVSILFGNRGISRRRGGFHRRSGSTGCEGSRKKNEAEEIIPNPNNKEK